MNKYIKLEDAKKIIRDGVSTDTEEDKDYVCDLLSCLSAIEISEDCINGYSVLVELDPLSYEYKVVKELPGVVSSAEQKHGRWILGKEISREYIGDVCVGIEYDGWQCSSCKTKVEKPYKPNWNYCPNCGTKMEVEE